MARRPNSSRRPRGRSHKEALRAEKKRLTIKEKGRTSHLNRQLDEGNYVIFDIESTGGNPDRNGITEIFALKIEKGVVVDTFYSMVNPMVRIPPIVRRMTGITNQMVKDAPTIDKVMPGFVAFIENHVLVSHNTIGDMKFLRYFSDATVGEMISNYFMCTHLLTEKMLPDTPDKSLKGLAQNLKLDFEGQLHRAEADTYLTYELFKLLLESLKENGINSIIDAIRHQADFESSLRLGWGISTDRLKDLPSAPGVFYLHDNRGEVLFFSSAKDIAREVKGLSRISALPKQLTKAVLASKDISYEVSSALFPATLREAEGLSTYNIRFSPSDWHQRVCQFVYLAKGKNKDFILSSGPIEPGATIALGPIRSGREIGPFLESVAEVFGKKVSRRGLKLSQAEAGMIESLLNGAIGSTFSFPLFPPLLFLKKYRNKWRREVAQIASLKNLSIPKELKPLGEISGVMGVPSADGWELFTIISGVPSSEGLYEGTLSSEVLHREGRQKFFLCCRAISQATW